MALCHLLGCTGNEQLPAASSSLWSHVDDVVGQFDDVEVVLNDDDRVALIYEFLQHFHEHVDVFEMETGGGLVEDV